MENAPSQMSLHLKLNEIYCISQHFGARPLARLKLDNYSSSTTAVEPSGRCQLDSANLKQSGPL